VPLPLKETHKKNRSSGIMVVTPLAQTSSTHLTTQPQLSTMSSEINKSFLFPKIKDARLVGCTVASRVVEDHASSDSTAFEDLIDLQKKLKSNRPSVDVGAPLIISSTAKALRPVKRRPKKQEEPPD